MKCLSLKQPFAELLASGKKTIELRGWNTHFRGRFLIHASLKPYLPVCKELGIDQHSLTYGAVIGEAELYGVKTYSSPAEFLKDKDKHLASGAFLLSRYRYGFLVKGAKRLKPIPLKGRLNFFESGLKP
jgi:hypothetical protein